MSKNSNEFHLTTDGIKTLQDELNYLTTTKRADVAARLKEAKAEGDLSENAMFDAARDDQAYIEGRIAELEHILKHAKVIKAKKGDVVSLGATVHVELESGQQRYTIVGSTEANPTEGRISDESPIGKALIGRKPGDEVAVEVPSGTIVYKILRVE